jgi:hypothetical protein
MILLQSCSTLWLAAKESLDVFGALGLVLGFAAGVMPRRTMILVTSAACGTCFSAHFLHLGSTTGMAMNLISVVQSLLAARFVTTDARPRWLSVAFAMSLVGVMGFTLATWNGWPSAYAGAGALLATAARLQSSSQVMRTLFLCATLCWTGHNLMVGSVCGLTCDVLTMLGFAIAIARDGALFRSPSFAPSPVR